MRKRIDALLSRGPLPVTAIVRLVVRVLEQLLDVRVRLYRVVILLGVQKRDQLIHACLEDELGPPVHALLEVFVVGQIVGGQPSLCSKSSRFQMREGSIRGVVLRPIHVWQSHLLERRIDALGVRWPNLLEHDLHRVLQLRQVLVLDRCEGGLPRGIEALAWLSRELLIGVCGRCGGGPRVNAASLEERAPRFPVRPETALEPGDRPFQHAPVGCLLAPLFERGNDRGLEGGAQILQERFDWFEELRLQLVGDPLISVFGHRLHLGRRREHLAARHHALGVGHARIEEGESLARLAPTALECQFVHLQTHASDDAIVKYRRHEDLYLRANLDLLVDSQVQPFHHLIGTLLLILDYAVEVFLELGFLVVIAVVEIGLKPGHDACHLRALELLLLARRSDQIVEELISHDSVDVAAGPDYLGLAQVAEDHVIARLVRVAEARRVNEACAGLQYLEGAREEANARDNRPEATTLDVVLGLHVFTHQRHTIRGRARRLLNDTDFGHFGQFVDDRASVVVWDCPTACQLVHERSVLLRGVEFVDREEVLTIHCAQLADRDERRGAKTRDEGS
eukprot:3601325-Prymnesium_polylepis.1